MHARPVRNPRVGALHRTETPSAAERASGDVGAVLVLTHGHPEAREGHPAGYAAEHAFAEAQLIPQVIPGRACVLPDAGHFRVSLSAGLPLLCAGVVPVLFGGGNPLVALPDSFCLAALAVFLAHRRPPCTRPGLRPVCPPSRPAAPGCMEPGPRGAW